MPWRWSSPKTRRQDLAQSLPFLPSPPSSLTYGELNHRANQLAHSLQARAWAQKRWSAFVSNGRLRWSWGCWAFSRRVAPMSRSTSYPQELVYMLQDADVAVLLTQDHLREILPATTAQVVCLDRDRSNICTQPSANPCNLVRSDNLAYVIYTSGSTGQPKGVQAQHGAAVNRFAWMWRTMPFAPHEVCCQKTAFLLCDFRFRKSLARCCKASPLSSFPMGWSKTRRHSSRP